MKATETQTNANTAAVRFGQESLGRGSVVARLFGLVQAWVVITTLALSSLVVLERTAAAEPVRNESNWAVVLCKFSDVRAEPQTLQWFRDFVFGSENSARRYFWDVSNSQVDIRGVTVGWYTMSVTAQQARDRGSRWLTMLDCLDAAQNAPTNRYTRPEGTKVVAVVNAPEQNSGSEGGWTLMDPGMSRLDFLAHEMGHGLGLDHSGSNDFRSFGGGLGIYDDPWDLMSALNVHSFPGTYGPNPTGLVGFHLDKLGWLPRNRVMTFGADGASSRTLTISAANTGTGTAPKLVRIPFDPANPFRTYTVEFRKKTGWDIGIPSDIVLIHEVRRDSDGKYRVYLQRDLNDSDRAPAQTLDDRANGVSVRVNSVDSAAGTASVTITSTMPQKCFVPYVWRYAGASDHVCVTLATRDQVVADNQAAPSRRDPTGPFGPDSCIQGYVWREAFTSDRVCVSPAVRDLTRFDNSQAAARRNPARVVYGPNTCRSGWVWREADMYDYVCVTPEVRTRTRNENSQAAHTRTTTGCISGYRWRLAYRSDRVCAPISSYDQAQQDNRATGRYVV